MMMTHDFVGVAGEAAIVELRRYALRAAARERLIALFDREFIETQEAVGMRVIGQFRDCDEPNSFVWFRGFFSMEARKAALTSFYGGPVWAAHRDEANGTMLDSDNVFLLRPASTSACFKLDGLHRPNVGEGPIEPGHFALTIFHLQRPAEDGFHDIFERKLLPRLSNTKTESVATLITEASVNTFPRLPVREGEWVHVNLSRIGDGADHVGYRQRVLAVAAEFSDQFAREPEVSLLTSTARSLLR
jgi:hypothetical protein